MVVTRHHLTASSDYKLDKPFTLVYNTIAHNEPIDKDNKVQVAAFEKLDAFIQDTLKQYYDMNGFVKLFDRDKYESTGCKICYFDYDSTNDKPYGTRIQECIKIGQVIYYSGENAQVPQDIICVEAEKGFALIQANIIYKDTYAPKEIYVLPEDSTQSADIVLYNALRRNFTYAIEKVLQLKDCIQFVFKDKEFERRLSEIDSDLLQLNWDANLTKRCLRPVKLQYYISSLQESLLSPIIDNIVQKYNQYAKLLGYNSILKETPAEQSDLESKYDI